MDRLNGHTEREPQLNASLTDCVFEVARETTAEAVNSQFIAASEAPLNGNLGYEDHPVVSTHYTNDESSSIVDALSSMVINSTQVKVCTDARAPRQLATFYRWRISS